MVEDGLQGLQRLRASLVAITLSFGCLAPHCSEAAFAHGPCHQGFQQHDPIALGCGGGNKRIKLELTQVGTPHHIMLWQAPAGTKDLRATAKLSPQGGGTGKGALKVACSGSGQVLLGSEGEYLNDLILHAKIHGAHWQWSGNQESTYGESFEEWFRINGTLPCDVEVSFTNEDASRLIGYLQYEWTEIDPCPAVPLGCQPCSEQQATCDDRGMVAVCDGSPFVDCMTAADAEQAAHNTGCCFTYYMNDEGSAVVEPDSGMSRGECDERRPLDQRGFVGWKLRCPKDAAEAEILRHEAGAPPVTMRPQASVAPVATTTTMVAAVPTTMAAAVPTTMAAALPTTSLLVPKTYELAGAFSLELQTSMDVKSDAFHELLLVALAESLGIHRNAFARLKIVENQDAERVQAVEATAGLIIIGVGYELFTGSAEREKEILTRLNNLGGPTSRMRASLVDILIRHGVGIAAVQVTYPAATVSQAMQLLSTLAPQSLPGGPLPTEKPNASRETTRESLARILKPYGPVIIGVVVGLVMIVCCCICRCCCRVVRTQPTGEQERLSRAEAGMQRPSRKGANSVKIAQNTEPRYPYEPVNASEERLAGSVSSVNRPPSVASDSSEAAGLRLLGNDGM